MGKQWKVAQLLGSLHLMGETEAPGFKPGPTPATAAIQGVNQWIEDLIVFQINKSLFLKSVYKTKQKETLSSQ